MPHTYKCSFEECSSELITFNKDNFNTEKQGLTYLNKAFIDKYKLFTKNIDLSETEEIEFLVTDSFWEFDNIGVSRSIETLKLEDNSEYKVTFNESDYVIKSATKYLICGDCDKGPLGIIVHVEEVGNPENKRELCLLSTVSVR